MSTLPRSERQRTLVQWITRQPAQSQPEKIGSFLDVICDGAWIPHSKPAIPSRSGEVHMRKRNPRRQRPGRCRLQPNRALGRTSRNDDRALKLLGCLEGARRCCADAGQGGRVVTSRRDLGERVQVISRPCASVGWAAGCSLEAPPSPRRLYGTYCHHTSSDFNMPCVQQRLYSKTFTP